LHNFAQIYTNFGCSIILNKDTFMLHWYNIKPT